jgi:predicted permease
VSGILEGFTVIGTIIAVGYVVGRLGVLGPEARTVLSRTAILVATPCLLFTTLVQTDLPAVFSVRWPWWSRSSAARSWRRCTS